MSSLLWKMLLGAGGGAAGAFAPSQITGLIGWESDFGTFQERTGASATTPATADADPVGTWASKYGASTYYLTTTADSKRPTNKTNQLNGLAVVRYDGSDDVLLRSSVGTLFFGTNQVNIFIVQKHNSTAPDTTTLGWIEGATNRVNLHIPFSGNIYYDYGDVASGGRISAASPSGFSDAWKIIEVYRSGGAAELLVNGTSAVSGTFTDDLDNTATVDLCIGAQTTTSNYFRGDIAAVYIVPTAQSAENRLALKTYLATKYGITVS